MERSFNIELLKEESQQDIYVWANGIWNKGTFMWFEKENIMIQLEERMILISIPKSRCKCLSFYPTPNIPIRLN